MSIILDNSGGPWVLRFNKAGGDLLSRADPLEHGQSLAYDYPPNPPMLPHGPTGHTNALGKEGTAHRVRWGPDRVPKR